MRVCMLVKNSFEYDARVTKEARSLIRHGHEVTVVALHVPGATQRRETREGIDVVRVDRLYGSLPALLPAFLRASTTTPGAAAPRRAPVDEQRPAASAPAAAAGPSWQALARRLLRRVLAVAGAPLRAANARVVDRRMLAAATASVPDVVHAHDLNTLRLGHRAASVCGAQLVYDAHELHTARDRMGPLRRWWAGLAEGRGIRHADAVITATDTWADELAARYRIPRPTVLRNLPTPERVTEPVDLRARLALPDDRRIVLYQGSIQANRGIEQTIEALAQLPDCVLVVVGYGAHRPVLEELVAARGLADQVRFDGPIGNTELVRYSAGADVGTCLIRGVSRSYRTSLPNKLFEYVMAGVPVVASDFEEMGAAVRREGVGEVCDPDDPDAVAAAIRRVLAAASRYDDALADAAARLNWETEQQRLLDAYAGLAGR